jgi:hypothetical protein
MSESDKWIVMTTTNRTLSTIRRFDRMHDWRLVVVVVGNRMSRHNDDDDNDCRVIYLDYDKQKKLNYKILQLIANHSSAIKAVGYLYAIKHGAKWIYDTDHDAELSGL